ncbi:MAG: hypothetical protein M3Q29_07660 [Chloroflexota bacterium]|nr:hypothetical protein [Chloroflexota bacterium]
MKRRTTRILIPVLILVLTVACTPSQLSQPAAQSHQGPVRNHVSFVDHLRSKGLSVEILGEVRQPFLRVKGTRLRVSGGDINSPAELQSYNYDDTDLQADGVQVAEADTERIGPDGNPEGVMVHWVKPPHFFHREQLIVLYVGDDPSVLALLEGMLGPQFAGR